MWSYGHAVPRRAQVTAAIVRGPRRFFAHPEEFGRIEDPQSARSIRSGEQFQFQAALMQHEVVRHAIEQMPRLGLTDVDLAAAIGVSKEQFHRYLRGESAMTIERLQRLAQHAGLKLRYRVERTE